MGAAGLGRGRIILQQQKGCQAETTTGPAEAKCASLDDSRKAPSVLRIELQVLVRA